MLKNDLVNDIKQVKLCNSNDCTNCLSCKYEDIADTLLKNDWRKTAWISVKDRLPHNHRAVLVVCESTTISGGKLISIGSYGGGLWSLANADGTMCLTKYMHFVVTHWQPLPDIPKGE